MTRYWQLWALATFLTFAIPETIALATRKPQNTLSDYVWNTFGVIRNQPISDWSFQHFAFAGMFLVFQTDGTPER